MTKYRISKLFAAGLALVMIVATPTRATTVIPPSFEQLVSQAEVIFQGRVTQVVSQWAGEGAARHIVSYVTFAIEESLKGEPGQSYTIRMLGGTVDGVTMGVADAPRFSIGDSDVLFVENNGTQFIPLVGIMYGCFRIQSDSAGRIAVLDTDGQSVGALAEFKAAIRNKLAQSKSQ
jgi:hypothetical protein